MADKNFLQWLTLFRRHYVPHRRAITPVQLSEMEFNFKEIGRMLRDSNPFDYRTAITMLLESIAARSFDMLAPDDYEKMFDEIVDLHERKNAGYAGLECKDAWANFRTAKWFNVTAFQGCLVRMGDKFIRVTNLLKNPEADRVNESIKDTLYDLGVYCFIAICLWQEEVLRVQCDGGVGV
jgi:hypothetical protein